jgi:hypothetical protein
MRAAGMSAAAAGHVRDMVEVEVEGAVMTGVVEGMEEVAAVAAMVIGVEGEC